MISRYYHTPDGERCRLFAIRPRDTMSAEHPGCLMVTLQPIARGIVLAERGTCLGWFSLEDIDSYHQHILAQGWECSGVRPHPFGGPRKSIRDQIETRMASLQRLIDSGETPRRTASTRCKIRRLCQQAGLPVPVIAA